MSSSDKHTIVLGIPKLPACYAALVMPLILSVLMTCIVSLVSTAKGLGITPQFVIHWLQAWVISWMVAFPVLLLLLPVVRRATAALVRPH